MLQHLQAADPTDNAGMEWTNQGDAVTFRNPRVLELRKVRFDNGEFSRQYMTVRAEDLPSLLQGLRETFSPEELRQ